uniref:Uncharacterized protein n=1 Tax=Arundo donax TaxID=35708 RepID=A0A0A8ZHK9_ARUDO
MYSFAVASCSYSTKLSYGFQSLWISHSYLFEHSHFCS